MHVSKSTLLLGSLPFFLLVAVEACTTNEGDIINNYYGGSGNEGPPGGAGEGGEAPVGTGGTDGDPDEYPSNRPECDTVVPFAELEIDLWGADGHTFYFEVTPEMRVAMDERLCDGGGSQIPYDLGGDPEELCPPSAFNTRVLPAGSSECADTGRVELDLPGQSSWMAWENIPNFKLDVGEFQDQEFSTGDKTVRMNNGQAESTIVREATALRIWRAMDYPAPRTSFVRTQSNVWDYDYEVGVFAAHNMVQPYKKPYFKEELPEVTSAWEGQGNPFGGWYEAECEWSDGDDCEDDVLASIVQTVMAAPRGEGFMAATESVIDWPMIHQNQCLSALTGTGDDWIHNNNNVVIALREDGKIMYLPYSTDISGGHPWYQYTPYEGLPSSDYDVSLTSSCLQDPECRTLALDTCDDMIDAFEELDVVTTVVQERCNTLDETGLKRSADEDVCDSLETFYTERADALRDEIEVLRQNDGMGGMGGMIGGPGPIEPGFPID